MGCCSTTSDQSIDGRRAWTVLACISTAWCLRVSAQHAGQPICHYGTLPGGWIRAPNRLQPADGKLAVEGFPIWQPYNLACQLRPLLVDYLQAIDEQGSNVTSAMPHMGILLFGDSVDYRVPRFLCNIALGLDAEPFNRDRAPDPYHLAGMCNLPTLTVAKQHIAGASLEGPYWNGLGQPPLYSIAEGLRLYQDWIGAPPNIVTVASNFWDIAAQYHNGGHVFQGTVLEMEVLPANWLASWSSNFTTILTSIKEGVPPETLLVFHTLHSPHRVTDPRAWEADPFMPQHVAQINAAGREVAQQLHYHVLDMEAMAAQLTADSLLTDMTHPGPDFMIQVLNILLNMESAHRAALQHSTQQPHGEGAWVKWRQRMFFKGVGRRLLEL